MRKECSIFHMTAVHTFSFAWCSFAWSVLLVYKWFHWNNNNLTYLAMKANGISDTFSQSVSEMQILYCAHHVLFSLLKMSLYHAISHFLPGRKWSFIILSIRKLRCTNIAYLISVDIKLNQWSTLCLCMQSSISCLYKDCEQRMLLTREPTPALFIAGGH